MRAADASDLGLYPEPRFKVSNMSGKSLPCMSELRQTALSRSFNVLFDNVPPADAQRYYLTLHQKNKQTRLKH